MKVILNLWIAMTLSGTIAFLGYCLLSRILKKYVSAALCYRMLKICLVFFLMPLPMIKFLIQYQLGFGYPDYVIGETYYTDNMVFVTNEGVPVLSPFSGREEALFSLWLLLVILLILWQAAIYLKFRRHITLHTMSAARHDEILAVFRQTQRSARNVKICCTTLSAPSFTFGLLSPTIVLSENLPQEKARLVIAHELWHIRNRDFLVRILALLTVALHCINPIVYLFFKEIKEVQEMNCDEQLTAQLTDAQRKDYGHLLIDMSQETDSVSTPALYFSANRKSFLKKRITHIRHPQSPKKRLFPAAVFCLVLILSCIPVFAYKPRVIPINVSYDDKETLSASISFDWRTPVTPGTVFATPDEVHFQYCDSYFVLDDGTVLPDHPSPALYASCTHTYVTGEYRDHVAYADGSCKVISYQVKFCSKCQYLLSCIPVSELDYFVCPHR